MYLISFDNCNKLSQNVFSILTYSLQICFSTDFNKKFMLLYLYILI